MISKKTRVLLGTVLFLFVLGITSFAFTPTAEAATCVAYYNGTRKGVTYDGREWHHYVDVWVGNNYGTWRLVSAPLPSSFWGRVDGVYMRLGYSWPSNWWDPFSASRWRICKYQ